MPNRTNSLKSYKIFENPFDRGNNVKQKTKQRNANKSLKSKDMLRNI